MKLIDQKGPFRVFEHEKDLSVSPSSAVTAYFSRLNSPSFPNTAEERLLLATTLCVIEFSQARNSPSSNTTVSVSAYKTQRGRNGEGNGR